MSCQTAQQVYTMTTGEVRTVAVHFLDKLGLPVTAGELLTGTPTVAEQTTSALTLDNKRVNTGTITVLSRTCIAGKAVQFRITASGATAGTEYTIKITCGTDATPAQTLETFVRVQVVSS